MTTLRYVAVTTRCVDTVPMLHWKLATQHFRTLPQGRPIRLYMLRCMVSKDNFIQQDISVNQLDVSMNTATTVYCAEKDGNLFVSIASKINV